MNALARRIVDQALNTDAILKCTQHFGARDWDLLRAELTAQDAACVPMRKAAVGTVVATHTATVAGLWMAWPSYNNEYSYFLHAWVDADNVYPSVLHASSASTTLGTLMFVLGGIGSVGSWYALSVLEQQRQVVSSALRLCEVNGEEASAETAPAATAVAAFPHPACKPIAGVQNRFLDLRMLLGAMHAQAAQDQSGAVKKLAHGYEKLYETFRRHEVAVSDLERRPTEDNLRTASSLWTQVYTGVRAAPGLDTCELTAQAKGAIARVGRIERAQDLVKKAENLVLCRSDGAGAEEEKLM